MLRWMRFGHLKRRPLFHHARRRHGIMASLKRRQEVLVAWEFVSVCEWFDAHLKTVRFAVLGLLCLLATSSVGEAQQTKIPRLCFLTFDPGTLRTRSPRFDGFFQGLQDLGYVNGR